MRSTLRLLFVVLVTCAAACGAKTEDDANPGTDGGDVADAGGGDGGASDAGSTDGGVARCGGVEDGSACGACLGERCCNIAQACADNEDCAALLPCLSNCEDAACRADCRTRHAAGEAALGALLSCTQLQCPFDCDVPPVDRSMGVGDRCDEDLHCRSGSCSSGLWCSLACTTDEDCRGSHPGGTNEFGTTNHCDAASGACFPSCSSAAFCERYGTVTGSTAKARCRRDDGLQLCSTGSSGDVVP